MSPRPPYLPSRLPHWITLAGGALAVVSVGAVFVPGTPPTPQIVAGVAVGAAVLLGSVVLARVLTASLAARAAGEALSRQLAAVGDDLSAGLRDVSRRLDDVKSAAADAYAPIPDTLPEPPPAAAAAPVTAAAAADDRVVALLEEIRELSLMNEDARARRLYQIQDAKRRAAVDGVFAMFRSGRWASAGQTLEAIEAQFPDDEKVVQARGEFDRARRRAEPEAFELARQRVDDLVNLSSFERAVAVAAEFVENFPAGGDGHALLARVHREHEISRESAFHQSFEEVQTQVARREWKLALSEAERLLARFPTHPRGARLRRQMPTIRENAEIQERQEHEVQIQALVRGRRFADAVRSAEDLARRYPGSPQAAAVGELLPRLRELVVEADRAEQSGVDQDDIEWTPPPTWKLTEEVAPMPADDDDTPPAVVPAPAAARPRRPSPVESLEDR